MGCSGHGRHLNRGGEPPIGGGRHRGCTHGGRLNEVPSEGPSSLEILQLQCAVHVILTRNWDCQRAHLEKGNSRGVMRDRPGWALAPEATPKVEGTQEPRSHWNRVKNPGTLRSSKDRDQPPCSGPVDSRAPGTGSALAYVVQAGARAGGTTGFSGTSAWLEAAASGLLGPLQPSKHPGA